MPDEFDEIYGHPELLPNELKGLREIRCDQCGHEMQILEQYENASVDCARCGQAITLHGVGLEIPEDVIDLKDGLPTSVFTYERLKQRRRERQQRFIRSLIVPALITVVYIVLRIIDKLQF